MARRIRLFSFLAWGCVLALPLLGVAQTPDDESAFRGRLATQAAMEHAKFFLQQSQPPQYQKAVEVLEKHVTRAEGSTKYLQLLRDAYRGLVRELTVSGRPDAAKLYVERLAILDPNAVNDPALLGRNKNDGKKGGLLSSLNFPNPFRKKDTQVASVTTVRPKAEDDDEPFGIENKRPEGAGFAPKVAATAQGKTATATASLQGKSPRELLILAEAEFKERQYSKAQFYFEQAYQLDAATMNESKDLYAYCLLSQVADQLNAGAEPAETVQKKIDEIAQLSPKLAGEGTRLLREYNQRRSGAINQGPPLVESAVTPAVAVAVKHLGFNKEGWQVAETSHFLIFHHQNNEFAEQVARIAEQTRVAMSRKWFGTDADSWHPKCELILHPNAAHYSKMTGVPTSSPGHSQIKRDPSNPERVVERRMDIRMDVAGVLESVLPHETTHVVLAGKFGPFDVPRWADEGIAVLSEPSVKLEAHRRNLAKFQKDGTMFTVRELLQLPDYPHPRRIGAFYAQSVSLVEYLSGLKGPQTLSLFIRDGLREGYDAALRRHYEIDLTQLEQRWQQQLAGDIRRVSAFGKD